ncbi:MAG: M50 family metallopeptidase [Clostridia bacterium]|nr:M50 family metallopeptidase [Clostridia bacterium]
MKNKTKSKKKSWQKYISIIAFMPMGVALGYALAKYADSFGTASPFIGLFLWLMLFVAFFIHIIVHEAGHLIFGLLSGYKFSSFRIFNFMWVKENEKTVFKRLKIPGTAGQCLMSPPDIVNGSFPVVLFNLGGVIMNIAASLVFLVLVFAFKSWAYVSPALLVFVLVGFVSALMNGIPMSTGDVNNDGYNAFSLSGNIAAMRSFWVQLKVNEKLTKGVRVKDMPAEWFEVPDDEAMKNSMAAVMGIFAANRLMDEQKFEEADSLMAHLIEIDSGITPLHRNLTLCDRAYVEMVGENRKAVLDELLTKELLVFIKKMKKFPTVLRTEYVYSLLVLKDVNKADKIKKLFDKVALTYPYPQDIQSERELMEIAEKKAV